MTRRLIALREGLGLSQSEFARQAEQSRSTVHGWETGRNKPDEDALPIVAKVLKTSISYLFGETDDPRPAPQWRTGEGPTSEWEARVEQAKLKLVEINELLTPGVAITPERAELLRKADQTAKGSSLHPELAAKAIKPVKIAKAK